MKNRFLQTIFLTIIFCNFSNTHLASANNKGYRTRHDPAPPAPYIIIFNGYKYAVTDGNRYCIHQELKPCQKCGSYTRRYPYGVTSLCRDCRKCLNSHNASQERNT